VSMPFAVPLDDAVIQAAAVETGVILTVEEHGFGGLGTAVGESIARSGHAVTFVPLRLGRTPIKTSGTQEQLRALYGLSTEAIVSSAENAYLHCASTSQRSEK
jgi:transketolase